MVIRGEELGATANARQLAIGQPSLARFYLGRFEEGQELLRGVADAMGLEEDALTQIRTFGGLAAAYGPESETRERLHALMVDVDRLSAATLGGMLHAANWLGERDIAADIAARLEPLAARLVGSVPASPVCARHLGAAAALLGKPDDARVYYLQALELCAKIRFRPEIALTRLQLAELLLEHYPDERGEALEHLDFAISEFREMKMQPSLERALRHRGLLKA